MNSGPKRRDPRRQRRSPRRPNDLTRRPAVATCVCQGRPTGGRPWGKPGRLPSGGRIEETDAGREAVNEVLWSNRSDFTLSKKAGQRNLGKGSRHGLRVVVRLRKHPSSAAV